MRRMESSSSKAPDAQKADDADVSRVPPSALKDQGSLSVRRVLESSTASTPRGLIEEIQALAQGLPSARTDEPANAAATDAGRLHELCLQIDKYDGDADNAVITHQLTQILAVCARMAGDASFGDVASAIASRAQHALELLSTPAPSSAS